LMSIQKHKNLWYISHIFSKRYHICYIIGIIEKNKFNLLSYW
jgi:hypothetical protein